MGELRGLSRWRQRYHSIGLDESLLNNATEKAGMLLVQVERFMKILSSVVQQVCLFFLFIKEKFLVYLSKFNFNLLIVFIVTINN